MEKIPLEARFAVAHATKVRYDIGRIVGRVPMTISKEHRKTLKKWSEIVREERDSRRLYRPTVNVLYFYYVDRVSHVPLVVSARGGRRREEASGFTLKAATFPKGGVDGCDHYCLVTAGLREKREETGVKGHPNHFLAPIGEPFFYDEPDGVELDRLRQKRGWERALGKVHFALAFFTHTPHLPVFIPQEGEIHRVFTVSSIAELIDSTGATPMQEWMVKVARATGLIPESV